MEVSGKWTSYIAKARHTFAIYKVKLTDIPITHFYITYKTKQREYYIFFTFEVHYILFRVNNS